MINRAGKSSGSVDVKMMLDMAGVSQILGGLLGAKSAKPAPAKPAGGDVGAAKQASVGLGKLETSAKSEAAPKGTLREADELKQQQDVEVAKRNSKDNSKSNPECFCHTGIQLVN